MTPQEQEDAKVVKDLQAIARTVDRQLPYGWGFIVLVFPFGAGGRMNYVANAERADIVRAMYEFIEATKGQWAEHEPEISAAAEDERLGRARQRIAELEREIELAKRRDNERGRNQGNPADDPGTSGYDHSNTEPDGKPAD